MVEGIVVVALIPLQRGWLEHETPLRFLPGIADHYRVNNIDPDGAARPLLALLLGRPGA